MKPALPVAVAIGGLLFRKLRRRRECHVDDMECSDRRKACAVNLQLESCQQKCQALQRALTCASTINDGHVRNNMQQADLVERLQEQVQVLQGQVSLHMAEVAGAHKQLDALKQQVVWLQNHNGGRPLAAEEVGADDSNQSIRQECLKPAAKGPWAELAKGEVELDREGVKKQEGLKPAAKEPWTELKKNMIPLAKVDPRDFQVTVSGDDWSSVSGDRVQAGSGTPRAASPDQGQIKAYSPAEPGVGGENRFPVKEFVQDYKKEHAALYKCRPAQGRKSAHQGTCVQPHHGLMRLFHEDWFDEVPKVGNWGVVNVQNMTGIMQMIHDSHGEHVAKKVRRPWLRCSLVVTEQDGQEEVALKVTEMPPRQMTIPVDDPTYDSDVVVAIIEKDKRSVDLQLLRAAQVLHVVRNLVEWAAHGGDFVFQGMESLPLTPERLLKHLALVVTGEAEVCALLDAGIEENAAMYDGEDGIPYPDKLQDIICPLCEEAFGSQKKLAVACFFCPTCARLDKMMHKEGEAWH
ncbi:hypothetical protein WJX77_000292 [Trebouxia sp. C0004]